MVTEVDQALGETVLRYFSRSELSMNIRDRFTQLFQCRPRWTLEELEPYLRFAFAFAFYFYFYYYYFLWPETIFLSWLVIWSRESKGMLNC